MKTSTSIPSNLINWDRSDKSGVAEISLLEHSGYPFEITSPWIEIESMKNGRVYKFTLDRIDSNYGDIAGCRYTSVINGNTWDLLIIND
jgi:hypothetical protein